MEKRKPERDEAKELAQAGDTKRLQRFLERKPTSNLNWAHLLDDAIAAAHPKPLQNKIQSLLYEKLSEKHVESQEERLRISKSLNPYLGERRKQEGGALEAISLTGVFKICLKRLKSDTSSPITPMVDEQAFQEDTMRNREEILAQLWGDEDLRTKLLEDPLLSLYCVKAERDDCLSKALEELEKRYTPEERREVIHSLQDNLTALECALWKGYVKCVAALGKFKCEPHIFDWKNLSSSRNTQESPLHIALRLAWEGETTIIRDRAPEIARMIFHEFHNALCIRNDDGDTPYEVVKGQLKLDLDEASTILATDDKDKVDRVMEKAAQMQIPPSEDQSDELRKIARDLKAPQETRLIELAKVVKNLRSIETSMKEYIFEELKDIELMSKALYGKNKTTREFFLDLSDFDQESHDFAEFVDDLVANASSCVEEQNDLLFEDTLFYAYLPDLKRFTGKLVHTAVSKLFDWLYGKGVRTILELNIPDNQLQPLSDERMLEDVFKRFDIRILDWRRLDVNVDLFLNKQAKLQELTLYSSGNWSVLYHWANVGLNKMRNVHIEFVEPKFLIGLGSREKFSRRMTEYRNRFLEYPMWEKAEMKPTFGLDNIYRWSSFASPHKFDDAPPIPDLKIFKEFKSCHALLADLKKNLDTYNKAYGSSKAGVKVQIRANEGRSKTKPIIPPGRPDLALATRLLAKPVKIAIIDNGTDKIVKSLYSAIDRGISYKDNMPGTRRLSWWTVADPHGTQMASLIRKVDPFCRLYIARVGRSRKDINTKAAINALRWATDNEVDIISISWVIPPSTSEFSAELLEEAKEAAKHALVFWSTADEGPRGNELSKVDPSSKFIRVSAANANNRAGDKSDMSADVLVSGEDIAADGPKYIKPNQNGHVSGSSVATALAAGIASLSLSLCRVVNEEERANKFKDKDMMLKLFRKMLPDGEQKIINPAIIFDGDEEWILPRETATATNRSSVQQDGHLTTTGGPKQQNHPLILPSAVSKFFALAPYLPVSLREAYSKQSSFKSKQGGEAGGKSPSDYGRFGWEERGDEVVNKETEMDGHAIAGARDDSQC